MERQSTRGARCRLVQRNRRKCPGRSAENQATRHESPGACEWLGKSPQPAACHLQEFRQALGPTICYRSARRHEEHVLVFGEDMQRTASYLTGDFDRVSRKRLLEAFLEPNHWRTVFEVNSTACVDAIELLSHLATTACPVQHEDLLVRIPDAQVDWLAPQLQLEPGTVQAMHDGTHRFEDQWWTVGASSEGGSLARQATIKTRASNHVPCKLNTSPPATLGSVLGFEARQDGFGAGESPGVGPPASRIESSVSAARRSRARTQSWTSCPAYRWHRLRNVIVAASSIAYASVGNP